MVAADHELSSEAGRYILRRGGNAVDAAIASILVTTVVRPDSAGIGGGGFLLIKRATGPAVAIDARETGPAGLLREDYLDERGEAFGDRSRYGGAAVGVPGLVEGLKLAHREYGSGRIPWKVLFVPAIRLAAGGFAVDRHLHEQTGKLARAFERSRLVGGAAALAGVFLEPDGAALPEGRLLKQPVLAGTLRELARNPEAFQKGPIAESIARTVQAAGGRLTVADLGSYVPVARDPIIGRALGHTFHSMPPPSSGGVVLLQAALVLDRLGARQRFTGPSDPAWPHVLVEIMKHGFADRATYLGDPDDPRYGPAVRTSVERMLEPGRIAAITGSIGTRTRPPETYGRRAVPDDGGTTHISVVDAEGNACAATITVNLEFGARLLAAGVVLNNELDDFTLDPSVPNAFGLLQSERNVIRPGRRPLSSMTPTIVTDDRGRVVLVAGASGGPRIITATLHAALNHLLFGDPLPEAVARLRFHHQWSPDTVFYEPGLGAVRLRALREAGHIPLPYPSSPGHVQAIAVDYSGGGRRLCGVSSPRKGGRPAGD
jgi:gamma-glutamyltranspeptidase/glutathione hydrolase